MLVPASRPHFQAALLLLKERGWVRDVEYELLGAQEKTIPVLVSATAVRNDRGEFLMSRSTLYDISERRQLEARLLHGQKLESLGVLAGGVAHDFNNLLTGVLGYADLALRAMPHDAPAREPLKEAISGGQKAADLTRQLLAYSGKGRFVVQPLDLTALVGDMRQLLRVSISKRCQLTYELSSALPVIEADAAQIRQVLMNLVINASEAIGDGTGEIRVTTRTKYCQSSDLPGFHHDMPLAEGQYVFLEVTDTGCGMSQEAQGKIFDPFFTTKFFGRGLGLAAVLGIVRGHRGAIGVRSEVGKGTVFQVAFPAANAAPLPVEEKPTTDVAWLDKGTALIVDDEETIREVAQLMLEMMGFSVLTAADGREGVQVFRQHAQEIRIVLLDMTMPHLDGEATYRELQRIRSNVPVILSSGYSEALATRRFASGSLVGFLEKPYGYEKLLQVVRELLGETG